MEFTENIEALQAALAGLLGSFALLLLTFLWAWRSGRAKLAKAKRDAECFVGKVRDRLMESIDTARHPEPRCDPMSFGDAMRTMHQIATDMSSVRAESNRLSKTLAQQRSLREAMIEDIESDRDKVLTEVRAEKDEKDRAFVKSLEELYRLSGIFDEDPTLSPHAMHCKLKSMLTLFRERMKIATVANNQIDDALLAMKADDPGAIDIMTPPKKVALLCEKATENFEYCERYMKEHDDVQEEIRQALALRSITADYRKDNPTILAALIVETAEERKRLVEIGQFLKRTHGQIEGLGFRSQHPPDVRVEVVSEKEREARTFEPRTRAQTFRGGEEEETIKGPTVAIKGQGHRVMPTEDPNVIEVLAGDDEEPGSKPRCDRIGGIGSWRDG